MYTLYIMHTMNYTHFIKKEEQCRIIYDYITFISVCLHDSPQGAYNARVLNVFYMT